MIIITIIIVVIVTSPGRDREGTLITVTVAILSTITYHSYDHYY